MIPNAEHWRISLHHAQRLQESMMGYLPGYATPRIVCDVPYLGKRWVHQVVDYDRERGISRWADLDDTRHAYAYYDPISTLPEPGRAWWSAHSGAELVRED
jgi:lysine 2,3-aminomutase